MLVVTHITLPVAFDLPSQFPVSLIFNNWASLSPDPPIHPHPVPKYSRSKGSRKRKEDP